jgi:hypothetical protein
MMGGAASKIKGSIGERELAKLLGGVFGGSFIRSAGSGAYVGGKNTIRKNFLSQGQTRSVKGDLVPPDFMPKFVVEVKSYADFRFHQLLTPAPCPQLDAWVSQTLDCVDPGDVWCICFKVNRLGWFVALPDAGQGYVFGNYCVYQGAQTKLQVTALKEFFMQNRALILRHSL